MSTRSKKIFSTFTILLVIAGFSQIFAQDVDAVKTDPELGSDDSFIRERLVELAWENHKEKDVITTDVQIAKLEAKQARWSWLNNIQANGNVNEFSLQQNTETQNAFFPRYNFSVAVPLGLFIQSPTDAKIAKERQRASEIRLEDEKQIVKREVLSRYEDYLAQKEVLRIQNQIVEFEYSDYIYKEEEFKKNRITLDVLNVAQKTYNQELMQQVRLRSELNKIEIDIERLIGVDLENVL